VKAIACDSTVKLQQGIFLLEKDAGKNEYLKPHIFERQAPKKVRGW